MADKIEYELCPETGIGCLIVHGEAGMTKIDLMPNEAADLRGYVQAGDTNGVKTLLADIDDAAAAALDGVALERLAEAMRQLGAQACASRDARRRLDGSASS